MQQVYFYSVIFVMGVVCSITMMLLLTHFSPTARKIPNYLSDGRYLQVRDDYSIYSLTSDRLKVLADYPNDKYNKKRNSVEGIFLHFISIHISFKLILKSIYKMKNNPDENEALSTLKVALELKLQGKVDKALRLFQHALALAPKHPEVLNKYGEYLEHSHSDVISADLMYFQVNFFNSVLFYSINDD